MPPWKLSWWLVFQDGMFISCVECFEPAGGLSNASGRLSHFGYHYGLHPGRTDKNGCPKHSTKAGTMIRIDLAPNYKDHMHFAGEDHIPQSRLRGTLVILDMTIFGFVARVLEHRQTGRSLGDCFGFEVISNV
jgi:hypothetical protein